MPYLARSITEFWRRWHITLSAWLRDYLYIPLGGNRKGDGRTLREPDAHDAARRPVARRELELRALGRPARRRARRAQAVPTRSALASALPSASPGWRRSPSSRSAGFRSGATHGRHAPILPRPVRAPGQGRRCRPTRCSSRWSLVVPAHLVGLWLAGARATASGRCSQRLLRAAGARLCDDPISSWYVAPRHPDGPRNRSSSRCGCCSSSSRRKRTPVRSSTFSSRRRTTGEAGRTRTRPAVRLCTECAAGCRRARRSRPRAAGNRES